MFYGFIFLKEETYSWYGKVKNKKTFIFHRIKIDNESGQYCPVVEH